MKRPLEYVWRADSVYDNWKSGKRVGKVRFRNLVCRMAAWYEAFAGLKPDDRWFDRVVEDLDLSLTASEVEEQMAERADIPIPPEHYRPGMTLDEVEAPELVRELVGTASISPESSRMQIAAVKAWITMWLRKGEFEKAEFAGKVLEEHGLGENAKPPTIRDTKRRMPIPESRLKS